MRVYVIKQQEIEVPDELKTDKEIEDFLSQKLVLGEFDSDWRWSFKDML